MMWMFGVECSSWWNQANVIHVVFSFFKLTPIISDPEYLLDQHILICVKSTDCDESYGTDDSSKCSTAWIMQRICCCCERVLAENLSLCCACVKCKLYSQSSGFYQQVMSRNHLTVLFPKVRAVWRCELPSSATRSSRSHWLTTERRRAAWQAGSSYRPQRANPPRSCMVSQEISSGTSLFKLLWDMHCTLDNVRSCMWEGKCRNKSLWSSSRASPASPLVKTPENVPMSRCENTAGDQLQDSLKCLPPLVA